MIPDFSIRGIAIACRPGISALLAGSGDANAACRLVYAATAWKTGVPYADLQATAEKNNLKADTYFLELADNIGTMFTMVEAEDE